MSEWMPENPYKKHKDASGVGYSIVPFDLYVAYAEGVRDAQRKLVEWGDEPCPHSIRGSPNHECEYCWQALRREVGL